MEEKRTFRTIVFPVARAGAIFVDHIRTFGDEI